MWGKNCQGWILNQIEIPTYDYVVAISVRDFGEKMYEKLFIIPIGYINVHKGVFCNMPETMTKRPLESNIVFVGSNRTLLWMMMAAPLAFSDNLE